MGPTHHHYCYSGFRLSQHFRVSLSIVLDSTVGQRRTHMQPYSVFALSFSSLRFSGAS
jgi:hypothetical protein